MNGRGVATHVAIGRIRSPALAQGAHDGRLTMIPGGLVLLGDIAAAGVVTLVVAVVVWNAPRELRRRKRGDEEQEPTWEDQV